MGGNQTKVKPVDFYHDAPEEKKRRLREIIIKRVRELELEDKIDLEELNEYLFLNHEKEYLRMTRKEISAIVSDAVSRPHVVLPNHIWFIRHSKTDLRM